MTQNVYVGSDIESVLAAEDPSEIPFLVAAAFQGVLATDFPERAAALAAEIAAERPHVVALQEVSLFRRQSPGDFLLGNPQPAETPLLDNLTILLDAIDAAGASYTVTVSVENFDLEVPMVTEVGTLDDIRLTDYDVILARSDVLVTGTDARNFANNLPIEVAGSIIEITRGYATADISVGGRSFRIINSHLEPADVADGLVVPELEQLQLAQAAELLADADASPHPVILMGDLNSAADGSTTVTYGTVLQSGFTDLWLEAGMPDDAYTANQASDLRNEVSQLYHRIDFVLYRDTGAEPGGPFPGTVEAELFGESTADWTPSGLWPSDHAAVVVRLRLEP